MKTASHGASRFRYQIESQPVAQGGRAWSVFEERPGGERVVLASGTLFSAPGETHEHQSLVALLQSVPAYGRQ